MKFIKYILICYGLTIFVGCKTTDIATDTIKKSIPASYNSSIDSSNTNLEPWRKIIFDPYLAALIDSSLLNNFDLRLALQKVEVLRSGIKFTKGIRLPDLSFSAAAGQKKFGEYTMDGVGNYDTQFSTNINQKQQIPNPLPDYYVGLQSSWEIDMWGKLKNKKKAAASRFIASQYGKDFIVTNLISEIANSYFELIALDNELKILSDNIDLQQSALDIVVIQKETGKANELAIEMLKAQLLNSKAIKAQTVQQVVECESKINFLCGGYPKAISRDSSLISEHVSDKIKSGIPSGILSNRPDVKQAEMELKATNSDLRAAKSAFYPTLTINSGIGFQAFNALLLLESPASLTYNILGGLATPLLNRRKLKADLMSSRAEQKQAYINYEKAITNSFMEVYNALNNIKNTQEMYDLKKEEVEMLKQSIYTSSELFRAGRASYLEIIMAQKNALMSQIELNNYKKRQNTTLINLYKTLGGGWK